MSNVNAVVAVNLGLYRVDQWSNIQDTIEKHLLPTHTIDEVFFDLVRIVSSYQQGVMFDHPEDVYSPFFLPHDCSSDKSWRKNRSAIYEKAKKHLKETQKALQKTKNFFDHRANKLELLKNTESLPFSEFDIVLDAGIKFINDGLDQAKKRKGGQRPFIARNNLATHVSGIWKKYTGQKATKNSRYNDKSDYSLYEKFACAVIEPILHPLDKENGVDSLIAESVRTGDRKRQKKK